MGTSQNTRAPAESRVTQHVPEPSLAPRCRVGHRDAVGMGVCQIGMLPIHLIPVGRSRGPHWEASELRERRCLLLGVSSLGKTPKIIFGLA